MKKLTPSSIGRSASDGALLATKRAAVRRRLLDRLRPTGPQLDFDLHELDIMVELDPAMVDWEALSAS